jgi:hypothetical protein
VRIVALCRFSNLTMRPSVDYGSTSGRKTVKYTVDGLLPNEGRASFVLDGGAWTILREKDGVYTDGIEKYESPEAALTSMNVWN